MRFTKVITAAGLTVALGLSAALAPVAASASTRPASGSSGVPAGATTESSHQHAPGGTWALEPLPRYSSGWGGMYLMPWINIWAYPSDPSIRIKHITWHSWGRYAASGQGILGYVGPSIVGRHVSIRLFGRASFPGNYYLTGTNDTHYFRHLHISGGWGTWTWHWRTLDWEPAP